MFRFSQEKSIVISQETIAREDILFMSGTFQLLTIEYIYMRQITYANPAVRSCGAPRV